MPIRYSAARLRQGWQSRGSAPLTPWRIKLAECLRPIRRWAPRGYGFIYRQVLGRYYGDYPGDPELKRTLSRRYRVFWDYNLRAYVQADLGDWACRQHYYKGVYHDRIVPLLVDAILADGGTFIDIGANRGIHTLYAARVLGDRGTVLAFEPNPSTFDVLRAHLTINQIANCTTFNLGLAAEPGELALNAFGDDHSGTCSFVPSAKVSASVAVPVRRFDDVVDVGGLRGPVLVKIDVEGYEHEVLRGMERALQREDLAIVCEVTDAWLKMTGSSAESLIEHLAAFGLRAHLPSVRYVSLLREGLALRELRGIPSGPQFDAFFKRSGFNVARGSPGVCQHRMPSDGPQPLPGDLSCFAGNILPAS